MLLLLIHKKYVSFSHPGFALKELNIMKEHTLCLFQLLIFDWMPAYLWMSEPVDGVIDNTPSPSPSTSSISSLPLNLDTTECDTPPEPLPMNSSGVPTALHYLHVRQSEAAMKVGDIQAF